METKSTNKVLAIINGKNFQDKKFVKLFDYFKQNQIDYTITSHKNHICEIIKKTGNYNGIIVIGGDGTIHEAVNSIDHTKQWLIFLPNGTVNCIARHLKIKLSVSFIHKLLHSNKTVSFDLLKATFHSSGKVFTKYILGFMTIGHLTNMTLLSEKFRWMPRFLRYPSAAFLNFFSIKKFKIDLNSDSESLTEKTCSSIIINNCSAEFFSSLQKSEYNDGKFEYLIENHNIPGQIRSIYTRYISLSRESKWKTNTKSLTLKFSEALPVMADGEVYHDIHKLELELIHSIQKVLLP